MLSWPFASLIGSFFSQLTGLMQTGKPLGNLEERGYDNLFLGRYKFGSRENPDMRC